MTFFVGTCVSLPKEKLEAFDDSSRPIEYGTFARRVGRTIIKELNSTQTAVPLKKDWHVRYTSGKWEGRKAVCMFHSGIHHIWIT